MRQANTAIIKRLEEEPNLSSTVSGILEELEAIESKRRDEVKFNETRQRVGDVATKLQAALALKDVFKDMEIKKRKFKGGEIINSKNIGYY